MSIIVDTSNSPYARLRPVPLTAVRLADTFWLPRLRLNRQVTLSSQYRQLEQTGRVDNFRRAAGKKTGPFQGYCFNDSDVYKWIEAAAWTLAASPDPTLEQMVDALVAWVAAAQQPDGYLNTYFMFDKAAERWTNLRDRHELYCAGHLIQAAIAHYRATGSAGLLDVARRLANHICVVFGPRAGQRLGAAGHPEIELALVELWRATRERNYLEQAQFFLDVRGQGLVGGDAYRQDHQPFRSLDAMVGHAVRAVYLNAGAADLYAETGEAALRGTLERLWSRMVSRQMYISGGIGSRYEGEAFGQDYELPNERAYAETCAAIGSVMWNWRMLALSGDARYADVLETALYNGVLAGLGLDGQSYFYRNSLATTGAHCRQPWFDCACCPPNIARLLAALPGYLYSFSSEGIWVHLYAQGEAELALGNSIVRLVQHTHYPWDGEIAIEVHGEGTFTLFLRVPGWYDGVGGQLTINGQPIAEALIPGSYAQLGRRWHAGDVARLSLPMPLCHIQSHPYVAENVGRIALMRGPLLYCVEQADHADIDLRDIALSNAAPLTAEFCPDLLGGVVVLRGQARVILSGEVWGGQLYRALKAGATNHASRPLELTAIPYYAWANRAPGPMRVWLQCGE